MQKWILAIALIAVSPLMAKTVYVQEAPTYVFVESEPPQEIAEAMTPSPGPDYVWLKGAWNYEGNQWMWRNGHWVVKPHPNAEWTAGYWKRKHHHWVWVPGFWS